MSELSLSVVNSLLKDFVLSSSRRVLYLAIDDSSFSHVVSMVPNNFSVTDLRQQEIYYSPLAPFLHLLKKAKCEPTINALYYPHQEAFSNYLLDKPYSERKDIIILEEVFYEQLRIAKSIVKLLVDAGRSNIVITNAQFLPQESIKIIKHFINSSDCKLILVFNKEILYDNDHSDEVNNFFNEVFYHKDFFDLSTLAVEEKASRPPAFNDVKTIVSILKSCEHIKKL